MQKQLQYIQNLPKQKQRKNPPLLFYAYKCYVRKSIILKPCNYSVEQGLFNNRDINNYSVTFRLFYNFINLMPYYFYYSACTIIFSSCMKLSLFPATSLIFEKEQGNPLAAKKSGPFIS